jgi:hypothetical protein
MELEEFAKRRATSFIRSDGACRLNLQKLTAEVGQ